MRTSTPIKATALLDCGCDKERDVGSMGACFSTDRTHRYAWWTRWSAAPTMKACMLNPSTADEHASDPTISRVMGFARAYGYGGVEVVNAFSFRSTDAAVLRTRIRRGTNDPFEDLRDSTTDEHIIALTRTAQLVVLGWGTNLGHRDLRARSSELRRLLHADNLRIECKAWTTTKGGFPKHPLYIRGNKALEPYTAWA